MNDSYAKAQELWGEYGIETAADLESHLENFSVLFAYNSGAIENPEITYHDTREIFEDGRVVGYTGNLRTLYEIANMKDAYRLMLRSFDERRPLSLELIKEMHYEIAKGTYDERRWELGERPGEFKKSDRWGVGLHDIAAPASEVELDLQEDLDELLGSGASRPLVSAAWFHARFEGIHAFADGNGRTGRALMNYYLISNGHPPIVIYEEDRRGYYDALDEFDVSGDLWPLVGFLQDETAKTWKAAVERHEASRQRELGMGDDLKERAEAYRQQRRLQDFIESPKGSQNRSRNDDPR